MDIKVDTIKIVNYINALNTLAAQERAELGLPEYDSYVGYSLPDGSPNIKERLKDIIIASRYGNQEFTNDCYFRFYFNNYACDAIAKLVELCKEAVNVDAGGDGDEDDQFLVFEVSL